MSFFHQNYFTRQENLVIEELHRGIFKIKNFLSKEDKQIYIDFLKDNTEHQWDTEHWNYEPGDVKGTFWHSRSSKYMFPFYNLHRRIYGVFAPELVPLAMFRVFNRLLPGESVNSRIARGENGANHHYNYFSQWKLGLYLGEFTGGELYFEDFDITVQVEENDLVVWRANYEYSVKEVTSGVRYSYSDFLTRPADSFFA